MMALCPPLTRATLCTTRRPAPQAPSVQPRAAAMRYVQPLCGPSRALAFKKNPNIRHPRVHLGRAWLLLTYPPHTLGFHSSCSAHFRS